MGPEGELSCLGHVVGQGKSRAANTSGRRVAAISGKRDARRKRACSGTPSFMEIPKLNDQIILQLAKEEDNCIITAGSLKGLFEPMESPRLETPVRSASKSKPA
jgi:hypothetical protein